MNLVYTIFSFHKKPRKFPAFPANAKNHEIYGFHDFLSFYWPYSFASNYLTNIPMKNIQHAYMPAAVFNKRNKFIPNNYKFNK